jgi:hypothetical protein
MTSAYLIPYFKINDTFNVLVVHKHVVSLKGVLGIINNEIIYTDPVEVEEHTYKFFNTHPQREPHRLGAFLYGGGQLGFFGGNTECGDEDYENTAIRGFLEQSGISENLPLKRIIESQLKVKGVIEFLCEHKDKKGNKIAQSFCFDIFKVKGLFDFFRGSHSKIISQNRSFFKEIIKQPKDNLLNSLMGKSLSRYETYNLILFDINELSKVMGVNLKIDIDLNEVINHVCRIISEKYNFKNPENFTKTVKGLIGKELCNWNIDAANALLNKLKPENQQASKKIQMRP